MNNKLIDNILKKKREDERIQFLPTREQVETTKWFIFHGACLDCEFQKNLGVSFCENCKYGMNDNSIHDLSKFDFNETTKQMFKNSELNDILKKERIIK